MNWRCSDFSMWKSVLKDSEFFHRCRHFVSVVMNFCSRAVNKWSAVSLVHNYINFFCRLPTCKLHLFFSILWTHNKKIVRFNDIFPQKLLKVINFWKHIFVLVLQIVQRRVSQVYQDHVLSNWSCDAQMHVKHTKHHRNNMNNKILWTWDLLLLWRGNPIMTFFTYFYSTLAYEL